MRILYAVLALAAMLSCNKTSDQKVQTPQEEETPRINPETPTGKTLVVYYSFTGNCKTIATSLAGYANADVLEILPAEEGLDYAANNYAIGSGLIAGIREKPSDPASYPAIKPVDKDAAGYDTVVIVTPLWWSNMAAIMQGYLFQNGEKLKDKNVGLIVSSASSGISSVVADAKRLVPDAKWIGEALWINNSNRSKSDELVKEWWKQ